MNVWPYKRPNVRCMFSVNVLKLNIVECYVTYSTMYEKRTLMCVLTPFVLLFISDINVCKIVHTPCTMYVRDGQICTFTNDFVYLNLQYCLNKTYIAVRFGLHRVQNTRAIMYDKRTWCPKNVQWGTSYCTFWSVWGHIRDFECTLRLYSNVRKQPSCPCKGHMFNR